MRGNNDGTITKQEWNDYYTDLSMSLPSDEYFVKMMESVWQICEDETSSVTQEQIKRQSGRSLWTSPLDRQRSSC